jgi:ribose 5-phosphate isomerase B
MQLTYVNFSLLLTRTQFITAPMTPSALITHHLTLASDHAGYHLKEQLKQFLAEAYPAITVDDAGCHCPERVDYPNIVQAAVEHMATTGNNNCHGMFICGSGVGVSMAANRFGHIRAVLANDVSTAVMSRKHNDSNVLCLGARVIAPERAELIASIWLTTPFEGGRHQERVQQLSNLHHPSTTH